MSDNESRASPQVIAVYDRLCNEFCAHCLYGRGDTCECPGRDVQIGWLMDLESRGDYIHGQIMGLLFGLVLCPFTIAFGAVLWSWA